MDEFIFASDLHGNAADMDAVDAFHKAVSLIDPKRKARRIFGGDLWDFPALRAAADADEKQKRLSEDFEAGVEFLDRYRPHVLLLGNHDQRLWDAVCRYGVRKAGPLAELADCYIKRFTDAVSKLKVQLLPYDRVVGVYRLGSLRFTHGFGGGNLLTKHMAWSYGNVVFGHGHRIEAVPVARSDASVTGYQCGCLCQLSMEYARSHLGAFAQQHGFAYGWANDQFHQVVQVPLNGVSSVYLNRRPL
jgi:hypothetical protein